MLLVLRDGLCRPRHLSLDRLAGHHRRRPRSPEALRRSPVLLVGGVVDHHRLWLWLLLWLWLRLRLRLWVPLTVLV